MAKVGCLGKVPFKVSRSTVQTIHGLSMTGAYNYTAHAPHLRVPVPEYTGRNLKEISVEATFSAYMGSKPKSLVKQILKYADTATPVSFTTGKYTWGYKWVITSVSVVAEYFDRYGNIDQVAVTINLLEYPRPAGVKKKR